ncbi:MULTISPECIES: YraN family protein [Vibrio]|uniref:YraN family protein n=1 Tax=Vibrio TaxID=662 RepID=UPI002075D1E4|nr:MULTISPECIES: YraN family protein [Vibrio]USD32003.1 YraN family protein [Vibrio sp. SCSIO 43186]USD45045.1 YraN family protein [Vibrio sp. SCSIO 43145]USD69126.1 YraN family protein [Vibrio sp. SCSIO 43139]USD96815.1 YraN family protein [Vibrio coralliilyticus]
MAWLNKRQSGEHYEALAEQYLIRQGLSLIGKNFHSKGGELDLIMLDGSTIVFIEVRYRSNQRYGHAAETVTPCKMNKLIHAANTWLMKQGKSVHTTDFRFDLVAMHQQGKQIDWIKNAITQG